MILLISGSSESLRQRQDQKCARASLKFPRRAVMVPAHADPAVQLLSFQHESADFQRCLFPVLLLQSQTLCLIICFQKLLPRLFESRLYHGLLLAVYPALTAFSIWAGWRFDPLNSGLTPHLSNINRLLSGRFEIWHNVFWQTPASLLGGVPTDGDEHSAIDNMYLALPMNKGVLGAVLVAAVFLVLLWRLAKGRHTGELLCMTALLAYLFMENKPFLLSANPLVLLLPCVFFARPDRPLPVLCPRAEQPQPAAAGQAR